MAPVVRGAPRASSLPAASSTSTVGRLSTVKRAVVAPSRSVSVADATLTRGKVEIKAAIEAKVTTINDDIKSGRLKD